MFYKRSETHHVAFRFQLIQTLKSEHFFILGDNETTNSSTQFSGPKSQQPSVLASNDSLNYKGRGTEFKTDQVQAPPRQITTANSFSGRAPRRPFDVADLGSMESIGRPSSPLARRAASPSRTVGRRDSLNARAPKQEFDTTDDEDLEMSMRTARKRPLLASPRRGSHTYGANLNAYGMSSGGMSVQPVPRRESKADLSDRIRVCVRKRPLNKKEVAKSEKDVAMVNGRRTIHFYEPK